MERLKNLLIFAICILPSSSILASNNITGEWKGYRLQYDQQRAKYEIEFEYNYNLTQVDSKVLGVVKIVKPSGNYASISIRGTVKNNHFYFEEYEVIQATRSEGFVWCLKKGVLNIEECEGRKVLKGNTPSFEEYSGNACTGGFTYLSLDSPIISEGMIQNLSSIDTSEAAYNLSIFPNPLLTSTSISFSLTNAQETRIDVIDIDGNVLSILENGTLLQAGNHSYSFSPNASQRQSYFFLRAQFGSRTFTRLIERR